MRSKRVIRWAMYSAIPVVLVCIVGLLVDRYFTRRAGDKQLAAVRSLLDTHDPRWRFDEIVADHPLPPEDQNSALLVPKIIAALGNPRFDKNERLNADSTFQVPPNRWLSADIYPHLDQVLKNNEAALTLAQSFRAKPHGLRHYKLAPGVLGTRLTDVQDTRVILRLLDLHAETLLKSDRTADALTTTEAMWNVSHSLEHEPFMIGALVRMACVQITLKRLERILALTTDTDLSTVQRTLLHEAKADFFWNALRAERATLNVFFEQLADGTFTLGEALNTGGMSDVGTDATLGRMAYAPHLPGDHAAFLQAMTKAYDARVLPEEEQREALQHVEDDIKAMSKDGLKYALTRLVTPSTLRIFDAALRTKAQLRCAALAVSIEQFHRQHKRWPKSLAELPANLPGSLVVDPFDGQPLRYMQRADGITIYSIGPDRKDDGGIIHERPPANNQPADYGFRLYNPDQRRQPALPPDAKRDQQP
jgi:hypothetical protein